MDNASKALIMAGAILISVAIVGIGIYIFSTANALTDDAVGQIDSLAVSSVNSRLQVYLGAEVRGSQVQQLVREVNAMNRAGSMPSQVQLENGTGSTAIDTSKAGANVTPKIYDTSTTNATTGFKDNARYKVEISGYNSAGYIEKIKVTRNGLPAGSK